MSKKINAGSAYADLLFFAICIEVVFFFYFLAKAEAKDLFPHGALAILIALPFLIISWSKERSRNRIEVNIEPMEAGSVSEKTPDSPK